MIFSCSFVIYSGLTKTEDLPFVDSNEDKNITFNCSFVIYSRLTKTEDLLFVQQL